MTATTFPDPTTIADEMIVAGYVRVTREESYRGDSPDNQRKRFQEIAAKEGWQNAHVFGEPGHRKGEWGEDRRPALAALMRLARAGRVQAVVVRHLDRLGRKPILEPLLRELRDHDVEIRTFSGPIDFDTAQGEAMVGMQAVFSRLEIRLTAERVRENRRRKLVEGYWPAKAPYGYTSQARFQRQQFDLHSDGNLAREEAQKKYPRPGVLIVDEDEAIVVRMIFDLVLQRRWGSLRIARHLHASGIRYRNGSRWRPQYVRRIFRDPKVAGWTHFDGSSYEKHRASRAPAHRQKLFDGKHEAIIDRTKWAAVQAIIDGRNELRVATQETARVYPLRGSLFDRHGHRLRGNSSGRDAPRCYACAATEDFDSPCGTPRIPASEIEDAVRDFLRGLLEEPTQVSLLVDVVNKRLMAGAPGREEEAQKLRAKVSKLEEDRARALRRSADAPDDLADVYAESARMLRADLERTQELLREAEVNVQPKLIRKVDDTVVAKYLQEILDGLDGELEDYARLIERLRQSHGMRVVVIRRHRARISMDLDPASLRQKKTLANQGLRLVQGGESTLPLVVEVQVGEPRKIVDEWVAAQQGKHICACGCGGVIKVLPKHHAPGVGIPKFILGHHRMHMTEFVDSLNADGYLTVGQAAVELGVSENTLRRAEEKGRVTPERRPWGGREPMRVYRRDDLPVLRKRLDDAGFRFRDDAVAMITLQVADELGVAENTIRKWERDGRIPVVRRDTCNRRIYRAEDVAAIREALAGAEDRDRRVLEAEGLITRQQAQDMLGIGHRSMQRLIKAGKVEPVWVVLPSCRRRRQCFRRGEVESFRSQRRA